MQTGQQYLMQTSPLECSTTEKGTAQCLILGSHATVSADSRSRAGDAKSWAVWSTLAHPSIGPEPMYPGRCFAVHLGGRSSGSLSSNIVGKDTLSGYVPWQHLPCPDKSPTSNSRACFAMGLQVGAAADVAAEAVRCADALRERLRKTARAVAGASLRPRVLLLESLRPLTLGECPQQCSSACMAACCLACLLSDVALRDGQPDSSGR